jgi:hypothetical protein
MVSIALSGKRILTLSFFCIRFYHRSLGKVNITKEKIFSGPGIFQCRNTAHGAGGGNVLLERRRVIVEIAYKMNQENC